MRRLTLAIGFLLGALLGTAYCSNTAAAATAGEVANLFQIAIQGIISLFIEALKALP